MLHIILLILEAQAVGMAMYFQVCEVLLKARELCFNDGHVPDDDEEGGDKFGV